MLSGQARLFSTCRVAIVHRRGPAVRSARKLPNLRAVLAQEYGLVAWFVATQPDLPEGVRAQLVDKDHAPQWSPASLEDLPADIGASALAFEPETALWS